MDILYLNIHAKNAMLDAKLVQDHFKMNVQAAKANTFLITLKKLVANVIQIVMNATELNKMNAKNANNKVSF